MVIYMKRILVFSDTHNSIVLCEDVINRIPCDLIFHAGDYTDDAQRLEKKFPNKEIIYVRGNCDVFSHAPDERMIEIDKVRIYLTHGHKHRVKYDSDYGSLAQAAREGGCAVAVFGHTHIAYCERNNGILLLNPGSAKYTGTYGIIEIDDGIPTACTIQDDVRF